MTLWPRAGGAEWSCGSHIGERKRSRHCQPFSLLVLDVLGSSALPASIPTASGDEPLTARNLRDTLATIQELSVRGCAVGATAGSLERRLEVQAGCARRIPPRVHGAARPRHR